MPWQAAGSPAAVAPAGRDGDAVALRPRQLRFAWRSGGEPGDVLVQDVVLALVGGQGPQHGGVQDQAERAELGFLPFAVPA
ncbi:hypothetical protein [Streptomyces sp. NPDC001435]|uniref:hypothetical protein n=1 Tax=Streptomyces sp. NPDC001435 TaxID=3364576 RepID=UPI0036958570